MVKKRQVIPLLATSILLPSCGQQSHFDSAASYWETIQNEPSPYGFYRMRDGWYQGKATRDVFYLVPSNEEKSVFFHVEEKVAVQIEWRQAGVDFGQIGPFGYVTGLDAHYYYEQEYPSYDMPMKAVSSIHVKEGQFSIEQTKWMSYEPDVPKTKILYGPCEKIDFRNSWAESYLIPKERQNYSFSDSDKVLKMTDKSAGSNNSYTFAYSMETLFSFDSKFNYIHNISYRGEGSGKGLNDADEMIIDGERETYDFAYLEVAPDFEVPQKGTHLEKYPCPEFMFANFYNLPL